MIRASSAWLRLLDDPLGLSSWLLRVDLLEDHVELLVEALLFPQLRSLKSLLRRHRLVDCVADVAPDRTTMVGCKTLSADGAAESPSSAAGLVSTPGALIDELPPPFVLLLDPRRQILCQVTACADPQQVGPEH